jgi:hypothetical protein
MSVSVACPQCRVALDVPDDYLGRMVRCAACATAFEARASEQPTPPLSRDAEADAPEPYPEDDTRGRRRSRDYYGDDHYPDDWDHDRGRPLRRDLEPHRGTMVLVFGILSLVLPLACGLPGSVIGLGLGIAAAIMGTRDISRMRQGHMDPDGETQTRVGQILSFVGMGLAFLLFVGCVAYFVFLVAWTGKNAH